MNQNKKKNETVSANYLEYVPAHKPEIKYEISGDKKVTLLQENIGLFNWIAQKLFKKPRVSQIHLDEMGNFIWPLIDGKRNLIEISELVREKFGDKAEPLYNRLVQYIKTLEAYGFITVNPGAEASVK